MWAGIGILTMPNDILSPKKLAVLLLLLLAALLSITVLTDHFTSPETHAASIEVLDSKKVTAMELTAAVSLTSAAISALPGDAATPVAEQISELITPLLIVVCAIYVEKFLLTTVGYLSFTFLLPVAFVLLGVYVLNRKEALRTLAVKLLLFALAVVLIIPASVKITTIIEATFDESIQQTMAAVDKVSEEAAASEENNSSFSKFLNGLSSGLGTLADKAKNVLSLFVDAIAVMVITTCVIPVAVLVLFVWLVKLLFGLEPSLPALPSAERNSTQG